MAEERSGFDLRRDGGGLVLFGAGAFLGVLSILALFSGVPAEEARGTSALALWWTALFGAFPSLVLAGVAAALGARSFLAGRVDGAARALLGALGVAAALSIGLSSISLGAGGLLGDLLGGTLARLTHLVVGVLLALVVLSAVTWFAWVRELARSARESTPARPAPRPSEPGERAESVSTEEAAALLPARREPALALEPEPEPEPPSPYPEDVRLRGEVPEGARPLGTLSAAKARAVSVSPREAEALAAGLPANLPEVAAKAPVWRPKPFVAEESESPELATPPAPRPGPPAVAELGSSVAELEVGGPPPPSWEQPSLFEEEEPAVDAYGTPLELVEELRGVERPSRAQEELDEELDEDLDEELTEELGAELDEDEEASLLDEESWEDEELEDEESAEEEEDQLAAELELGDEDEAEAEEESDEERDGVAEPEDGRLAQAELAPQPMPAGELERRLAERPKMLYEAGRLFLDRGRVAVSLLQREYGMTFDEACTVLDELQEMGLIGPYLGGKHRDILLSSEEWLERVSSS